MSYIEQDDKRLQNVKYVANKSFSIWKQDVMNYIGKILKI